MSARSTLIQLLHHGFRGTCAAAAMETGLAKVTCHVELRELEAEGIAKVVATEINRGGVTNIWGAAYDVGTYRSLAHDGIVASALASRGALERHWVAVEHPA